MTPYAERIAGGIWGMLVGDALGVPYEFHPPEQLPPFAELDMVPPVGFRRAHASVPPGTWSDDGAQALALLDSLLRCGRLDLDDYGRRLLAWHDDGAWAVGGVVFDVGIQTGEALQQLRACVPARTAGPAHERANGNGALMRVLPLALWHTGSDTELIRDACEQSLVTHGHLRSQLCCALYCLWARGVLRDDARPWETAVTAVRAAFQHDSTATAELEWHIRPDDDSAGTGSGYVVDSLRSARHAVQAGAYDVAVKTAVALGHDTDTTACIAGGIAGLRDGVQAIPPRWLSALREQERVAPLIDRLIDRHISG